MVRRAQVSKRVTAARRFASSHVFLRLRQYAGGLNDPVSGHHGASKRILCATN